MQITVSSPNRPSITADVDFPPRPGDRVVVEHDYYRVDAVHWTWDAETGMRVRVVVVDMHDTKGWRGWSFVVVYVLAVVGIATLLTWCVVGLG